MNYEAFFWISVLKGIFVAVVTILLYQVMKKPWPSFFTLLIFTCAPWLMLIHSDTGSLIEKMGRLALWGAEAIISLFSGSVTILFYQGLRWLGEIFMR